MQNPTAADLQQAQNAVSAAQSSLDAAQAKLDQLKNPTAQTVAADQQAVSNAQASLAAANTSLNALYHPDAATVKSAQLNVDSAQAGFDAANAKLNALLNPTAADVAAAQATVNSAQASLDAANANLQSVLSGPQKDSLNAQQLAVQQAQNALTQAQANMAEANLTAPIDGTVTAVTIHVGDNVSTSGSTGAMTILDPTGLYVQSSVAETDLPNIKVGQPAIITLDALPNQRFTGQVTTISPAPTVTQGVVTYQVLVSVTNLPTTGGPTPGMTATATITTESRSNVLIVPSRAIQRKGAQQIVTVMVSGKQQTMTVTTGLTANSETEVDSGLKQGDVIVIPATTTTAATTTAGGARGFGGGGFGGGGFGGGAVGRQP